MQRDVAQDIIEKFPNTIKLAVAAMFIAVPTGIILGVISATGKKKFWGSLVSFISIGGISLPVFWMGLILI